MKPKAKWTEHGDSWSFTWGHVRVGEVTLGGNGTWYAYYTADNSGRMKTLKDFPALDIAQDAVERALAHAAELLERKPKYPDQITSSTTECAYTKCPDEIACRHGCIHQRRITWSDAAI